MATWKLIRQISGNEEFTFSEGDKVTIGRGVDNTITLSSIVISRNHCEVNVQRNEVLITDLKSSNGIYVGVKKIPPNEPYVVVHSDIIGFGWTVGARLTEIEDEGKFVFKLVKVTDTPSLHSRIKFQNGNEYYQEGTDKNLLLHSNSTDKSKTQSPKRKVAISDHYIKKEIKHEGQSSPIIVIDDDIVSILSDSDKEDIDDYERVNAAKKIKLESNVEYNQPVQQEQIKQENEYLEYEAFDVKQEYLAYDDEPIQIDSDSDNESEHWILRLSQNSPGKPFTKIPQDNRISEIKQDDCSYSQLDDYAGYEKNQYQENEEDIVDDLIIIPPHPPNKETNNQQVVTPIAISNISKVVEGADRLKQFTDDLFSINQANKKNLSTISNDQVDGFSKDKLIIELDKNSIELTSETKKKTQMIHALAQPSRVKSCTNIITETKKKSLSSRHTKVQLESQLKRQMTTHDKEKRKKKLKEIAEKEKFSENNSSKNMANSSNKSITNVKITPSNRGAFLTDVVQIVKPTKRKEETYEIQKNKLIEDTLPIAIKEMNDHENSHNNKIRNSFPKDKTNSQKLDGSINKCASKSNRLDKIVVQESQFHKNVNPIANMENLNQTKKTISGKPFSKVVPLPPNKPKKKVRFSEAAPQVHVFAIEPGNKMNKTSLAKTFVEQQLPRFSLEKFTLMKILRWNPHWLEEQIGNNDPPPILGPNVAPTAKLHIYEDHNNYQQSFGDLLLIEIWECLTVAYMKTRNQNNTIQFRIESLPPVPPPEHCFDLFNISVNMSLPSSDTRSAPRVGDIILVTFGLEIARNQRFFFVHHVRCLPSPPTNKNSFYSISLQATFTGKMQSLKAGEVIIGKNLVYINKELMLFEALEHLNGSPLCKIILCPEPRHFQKIDKKPTLKNNSQWTIMLNSSQKIAVNTSVSAALNDRPSINMVQGPPGTGKSSVICAIIVSYFYDGQNKRQQNRGKILICATSNAAVDELVIRLLNIRQSLPKGERFRMVRVGRAEAMHPRALDVSSHQLALRDARSQQQSQAQRPGLSEEISHLEAKVNMWKTAAQDAKDPVRVAYCQTRVTEIGKRIALVRANLEGNIGPGAGVRVDQLIQSERRIIEGADIVLTTLASAHNHKMKGLKERIALCIIDEAGQAIEPETLIPLMLGVKRLTLIGDPQQLPGYICSQRAKKHGLGESLFSRLTSCMENWTENIPVVLLQQQYRMHVEIADYPNRAFYDSKIETVPAARPKLNIPPYSVISISSGDKGQGSCGANEIEAWGVARLVLALNEMVNVLKLTLVVITPYNAHKELIKKNLRMLDPRLVSVDVNTVDSFQGQERDVVVVSLARSQGVGFLTDTGRMNVMLTRARHALLVCLNPSAMLRNHQWRTLIEDAQRRNVYRVLPTKICQPVTNRPVSDDILKYLHMQPNEFSAYPCR